ncbi:MAG: type ISP restriction/modification enzyme [Alphaproteobacteria bacterium]
MSESLIAKNGEGILGFITNHGYLDNPTFRGMRWHLLRTFDKIYVLDLHGNSNKKEVTPEGLPDKNVFDIQQGVAIIIAIKKSGESEGLAEVYHGDLWGSRDSKYKALGSGVLGEPLTLPIVCPGPQFAFVRRNSELTAHYEEGFHLPEFMPANVTGIVTAKDGLVIDFSREALSKRISRFVDPSKTDAQVREEFFPNKKPGKYPPGATRGWKLPKARESLQGSKWQEDITEIAYRPFNSRAILYRPDMVDWGRFDIMRHMLDGNNLGLICPKIKKEQSGGIVTSTICGHKTYDAYDSNSLFPLYLYPGEQDLDQSRRVNFDSNLYERLRKLAKDTHNGEPDEVQAFDYIFGVLHCPEYRETYAEFLKIDFPRIPWPKTSKDFWAVSEKGRALRKLHLIEPASIGDTPYPFKGDGDNVVDKPEFKDGKVWINKIQYFDNAPSVSWEFYIGGYQPAQKWLKDRKGRPLSFDDIKHYQRILKILAETDRIMKTIIMTL